MPGVVSLRRRLARTVAFAGVLSAGAVLAHRAAGGMAPPPPVVAVCTVVLLAVGWLLSPRDRSWGLLAGAAAVAQLAQHLAFSATMSGPMGPGSPSGPLPVGGTPTAAAGRPLAALAGMTGGGAMLVMAAAHAAVAVVALLALRHAESTAALLVAALGVVLTAVLPGVPVRAPGSTPRAWARTAGHRGARCCGRVVVLEAPRRGPPLPVAL